MEEYKGIYKCRLCGETLEIGSIKCKEEIIGFDNKKEFVIDKELNMISISAYSSHRCRDGSFGILDFHGFKKVERA